MSRRAKSDAPIAASGATTNTRPDPAQARNDRTRNDGNRSDGSRNDQARNDGPRNDPARNDGPRNDPARNDWAGAGAGGRAPSGGGPATGTGERPGRATPADTEQRADPATVAEQVRSAVLAVPGVTGLSRGTGVEAATQFAGGKITGIRLGDPVEVYVEIGPVPIAPVAERVGTAVRDVLERFGLRSSVDVVVEDVDLPLPAVVPAGS